MQKKKQRYITKGMKQDLSISKLNNEYSFSNKNIRIQVNNENTLLTVTNEKGAKQLIEGIKGWVLGHCIINNQVIIFSTTNNVDTNKGSCENPTDHIYLYNPSSNNLSIYYEGNLNFHQKNPIESLASYETELIQKVYWVDNRNEPRVLNIVDPRCPTVPLHSSYSSQCSSLPKDYFDFTSELILNEEMEVTKDYGDGLFPSGVIQYAFNYYNVYGKQSNIIDISPIQYMTHVDRGASPEDSTNNIFRIKIKNVDTRFDFLRLYSIQRTSLNDTPLVYKVVDIKLDDKSKTTIEYTDNNRNLTALDNTLLYYVGGESIIPKTLTQKDNTAFFGNYTLKQVTITKEDAEIIKKELSKVITQETFNTYQLTEHIFENTFKLNKSEKEVTTFKYGEDYYLGIQFQYINGKYSEPIYIGSFRANKKNRLKDDFFHLNRFLIKSLPQSILTIMSKYNFKRVRPLIQYPEGNQRRVICQGVVNPTVFNTQDRETNSPYAQSSWFFRPIISAKKGYYNPYQVSYNPITRLAVGNPEFRHFALLPNNLSFNCEIQSMGYEFDFKGVYDIHKTAFMNYWNALPFSIVEEQNRKGCLHYFAVDNSLITLNSPELEDEFSFNINNTEINIIGLLQIKGTSNKYASLLHNPPTTHWQNKHSYGKVDVLVENTNGYYSDISNIYTPISSCLAGPFWRDWAVFFEHSNRPECLYTIYPFHATGPLNNRKDYPLENVLKTKTLTSHKYSNTIYLDDLSIQEFTIPVKLANYMDTDNPKLIQVQSLINNHWDKKFYSSNIDKILSPTNWGYDWHNDRILDKTSAVREKYLIGVCSDLGNIDTMLNKGLKYEHWSNLGMAGQQTFDAVGTITGELGFPTIHPDKIDNNNFQSEKPVSVKYKSQKHIVLSLDSIKGHQYILPLPEDILDDEIMYSTYPLDSLSSDSTPLSSTLTPKEEDAPIDMESAEYKAFTRLSNNINIDIITNDETPTIKVETELGSFDDIPVCFGIKADPIDISNTSNKFKEAIVKWYRFTLKSTKQDTSRLTFGYLLPEMYNILGDVNPISEDGNTFGFTIPVNSVTPDPTVEGYHAYSDTLYRLTKNLKEYAYFILKPYFPRVGDNNNDNEDNNSQVNPPSSSSFPLEGTSFRTIIGEQKFAIPVLKSQIDIPSLYLVDFINKDVQTKTLEDINHSQWLIAGYAKKPNESIIYDRGDTYYQRYECIKTLPLKEEDPNRLVESLSFMVETRINLDGRYDRNKGNKDYSYITNTTFNLFNPVYNQRNNYFTYTYIDPDRFKNKYFPNQVTWTKQKTTGELTDTWTNLTLVSNIDLDNNRGPLNLLTKYNNEITFFQNNGFGHILFNSRVQIPVTDGVPIEIGNGLKVEGKRYISEYIGCQNKWSVCNTPTGIYFMDNNSNTLYLFNNGIQPLSDVHGFRNFFTTNNSLEEYYPSNDFNNFITFYDETRKDVYFVNKENLTLNYSEQLQAFESFFDYHNTPAMFNIDNKLMSIYNGKIWLHNEGTYNQLRDIPTEYSIEYKINPQGMEDKIFTNAEFRADSFDEDNNLYDTELDLISVKNEYQDTQMKLRNNPKSMANKKQKFRIWRVNIPRPSVLRRIRNPWINLKLTATKPTKRNELHDLTITYYE